MEFYKIEYINTFIICLAIIGIITSSTSTLYNNVEGIISGYSITVGSFLLLFILSFVDLIKKNVIKNIETENAPQLNGSWEDAFAAWVRNLTSSMNENVLDITNSKIEKIVIKAALEKTNGKKNEAAILLGLGRNTLAKKIKELEI